MHDKHLGETCGTSTSYSCPMRPQDSRKSCREDLAADIKEMLFCKDTLRAIL